MSKRVLQAVLVGVVVFILLTGIDIVADRITNSRVLEGRVMFDSEQEYSGFKRVIGTQPGINIRSLSILSSTPPVVVDFELDVPNNVEWPYGGTVPLRYAASTFFLACLFVAVAASAVRYLII